MKNLQRKASIGDALFLGNPDTATVAVIEYSDYLCGFCQRHCVSFY